MTTAFPIAPVLAFLAQVVSGTQGREAPAQPALPSIQAVVGTDALRTDGPVARYSTEFLAGQTFEHAPDGVGQAYLLALQLVVGPKALPGRFARDADWSDDYSLRARLPVVFASDRDVLSGPMTLAVQRYHRFAGLSVERLLNFQVGLEAAVSTPWLSGRAVPPPAAVQVMNAIETELAQNGWSIRPATGYVRGDFLACRSLSLEVGSGPELFIPTQTGTHSEYGFRFRTRAGASVACAHSASSIWNPWAISLQYDERTRLPTREDPAAFHHLGTFAIQYHFPHLLVHVYGSTPAAFHLNHYWTLGLQMQLGVW